MAFTRTAFAVIVFMIALAILLPATTETLGNPPPSLPAKPSVRARTRVVERRSHESVRFSHSFAKLPLHFVERPSDATGRQSYHLGAAHSSVLFTSEGVTFRRAIRATHGVSRHSARVAGQFREPLRTAALRTHELTLQFPGANEDTIPFGAGLTQAAYNYFGGPGRTQQTGLKTFSSVVYSELWPGIDLAYSSTDGRLKYTFEVKPGADAARIQLAYTGASTLTVNASGQLSVDTAAGIFVDEAPYIYQEINGKRVAVTGRYLLGKSSQTPAGEKRFEFGFQVGSYDSSYPLVIDPASLAYATFVGGAGDDNGLGIALDASGNAYICGVTLSPVTNSDDAYVAKLDPTGTNLVYFSVIGGTGTDNAFDIAVDANGSAYITGATDSSETTFPITMGPDLTFNGRFDAFVAKLNPAGNGLLYAGYLGGRRIDFAEGIAVDNAGNAYIAGVTESNEQTFPVTVGPDLTHNGRYDLFVAKVKTVPNDPVVANNLAYSGYIGGRSNDAGILRGRSGAITSGHISIDASGNAYLSGITESTEATFPDGDGFGAVVGFDRTHNGGVDAFVAKLNASGTALIYATYLGGAGFEWGYGMAVDTSGNAHFTGVTSSNESTFPVTVGPDLTFNGEFDAYVAKLDASGTVLLYCGYLGGAGLDQGFGVALDARGDLYVAGYTLSDESSFPVLSGPDLTYNGGGDGFVAKVDVTGAGLLYSGFVGGAGDDVAFWISVDAFGRAYVVGASNSTETTFPDGDGFGALPGSDRSQNGGYDAFVVKVVE